MFGEIGITKEKIDTVCDGCGRQFVMGDKLYILHIWIHRRDLCRACTARLLAFIDSLKPVKESVQSV